MNPDTPETFPEDAAYPARVASTQPHPVQIETIEPSEASFEPGLSESEQIEPASLEASSSLPTEAYADSDSHSLSNEPGAPDSDVDAERVMVGRFQNPSEAQMAKGMLEAAGIESFLQGENANAMVPMAFRSRLTVAHADEAEARALMASAGEPADVQPDDEEDLLG